MQHKNPIVDEESKKIESDLSSNAALLLGMESSVPKLFNLELDLGKSLVTTMKHLNYIAQLAEIFSIIHANLCDDTVDRKYTVFYYLAFAGEIVAKQEKLAPKLPDNIRAFLPEKSCALLQDMRNNHLVHDVSFEASMQDVCLYKELKKDQAEFLPFREYLTNLGIINAIYESYQILEKINDAQFMDRFSKWKEFNEHAKRRIELIAKLLKEIPAGQTKEQYQFMLDRVKIQSDSIDQAIQGDLKPDAVKGTRLFAFIKEPSYQAGKQKIIDKKNEILDIAKKLKIPNSPNFCDNFKTMLNKLSSKGNQEKLRDRHWEKLKEVSEKLQPQEFKEGEKENLLLEGRWHILQVCSALEKLEEGSLDKIPAALKVLQKQMIHDPNKVVPEKEIQQIAQVIEGGVELQPQQQKKVNEKKRGNQEDSGATQEPPNIRQKLT